VIKPTLLQTRPHSSCPIITHSGRSAARKGRGRSQ